MTRWDNHSPVEFIEVSSIPEPNSGCWLWLKSTNSWGYGRAMVAWSIERQAHRLSYVVFRGPIIGRARVLHRCDEPLCVNPDHLRLGTDSENVQDCIRRGRHVPSPGERNGQSKLTYEGIADLRSRSRFHGCMIKWAAEFGVSRRAIQFALRGETWR